MKVPKAYSILLIGTGIFVYWLIVAMNIEYSIDNELNGFPPRHEITAYRANTSGILNSVDVDPEYLETLRPAVEEYREQHKDIFQVIVFNTFSQLSAATGFLILFSGAILLLIQKLRHVSNSIEQKPVSVKWQIMCSFLPGFDLWALYRIQKLRIGGAVIAIMYISSLLSFYSISPPFETFGFIQGIEGLILAFFFYLWSRDWNRNLTSKEYSRKDTTVFMG